MRMRADGLPPGPLNIPAEPGRPQAQAEEDEDIYAGLDAAVARWIYLVLSGSSAFSNNMGQQYDEPKCACVLLNQERHRDMETERQRDREKI